MGNIKKAKYTHGLKIIIKYINLCFVKYVSIYMVRFVYSFVFCFLPATFHLHHKMCIKMPDLS